MTQPKPSTEGGQQEIKQQAGKLLPQVTGHIDVKAIDIGLRFGLSEEDCKAFKSILCQDMVPIRLCLRGPGVGRDLSMRRGLR